MVAALDSFWWWLLAAVLGGVIGAVAIEAIKLSITDRIRRRQHAEEERGDRNRAALQTLVGPLNDAFGIVDTFAETCRTAQDRVTPQGFPISRKLEELDRAWKQASPAVTDKRVHDAFRNQSPMGLTHIWEEESRTRTTKAELEELAVDIHNGLNDLRLAMAPYLPGLMPDDLPAA